MKTRWLKLKLDKKKRTTKKCKNVYWIKFCMVGENGQLGL